MGEEPPGGPKPEVSAAKFVTFIGTLLLLLDGFLYIRTWAFSPTFYGPLYLITGIISITLGALLFFIVNIVDFKFEFPIPYKWWVLLAMGGGMIALNLITQFVVYGYLLGTARYRGGLLVGLAGLLVLLIEEGKLEWSASKFVLLVGSSIAITMSILTFTIVWAIFGIALCVLLILAIFDVAIPNEWWLSLMIGSAIFVLIHWVSGMVILVGFLLVLQDK